MQFTFYMVMLTVKHHCIVLHVVNCLMLNCMHSNYILLKLINAQIKYHCCYTEKHPTVFQVECGHF